MINWIKHRSFASAALVLSASLGACSSTNRSTPDWQSAAAHFAAGEERSPYVFDRKAASRCVGRWRLHADAVDDGAFPPEAYAALTEQLRLRQSINAAEFFTMNVMVPALAREASDEAETLLRKALEGDAQAFQLYFEALGRCSTKPVPVEGRGGNATDEAVEGPAG
ncbi:hypothetical protein [Erythrobacter crassostreae]|uniref:Lipoprotein n=1 Tax=Erythrobacter crassostreae TaxID=2828328 RepID=A0A9X1F0Z1_9SPHN|nr:hypothetical protein [Erythrobacter crassostrea]MBV7258047.1 hypothetical protein [Erythrobacter crassostrea]